MKCAEDALVFKPRMDANTREFVRDGWEHPVHQPSACQNGQRHRNANSCEDADDDRHNKTHLHNGYFRLHKSLPCKNVNVRASSRTRTQLCGTRARTRTRSVDPSDTVSVRWINRVNMDTIRFRLVLPIRYDEETYAIARQ